MITFILAVCGNVDYVYSFPQSPPSRAAWIEITVSRFGRLLPAGRRLHGRRGLKFAQPESQAVNQPSPPSRAAWIEMSYPHFYPHVDKVAAFTGGVD